MDKKMVVHITVTGRPASGKKTIMREIVALLQSLNVEVQPVWGIDGEPRPKSEYTLSQQKEAIATKTKVVITEQQAPRRRT